MIENLNENNFNEKINKEKIVLVDFWATWCGPCRILSPILDELSKEYEEDLIEFKKVNVDDNGALVKQYEITAVPTLLFFKNGKKIHRVVGGYGKNLLKNNIENILKNN